MDILKKTKEIVAKVEVTNESAPNAVDAYESTSKMGLVYNGNAILAVAEGPSSFSIYEDNKRYRFNVKAEEQIPANRYAGTNFDILFRPKDDIGIEGELSCKMLVNFLKGEKLMEVYGGHEKCFSEEGIFTAILAKIAVSREEEYSEVFEDAMLTVPTMSIFSAHNGDPDNIEIKQDVQDVKMPNDMIKFLFSSVVRSYLFDDSWDVSEEDFPFFRRSGWLNEAVEMIPGRVKPHHEMSAREIIGYLQVIENCLKLNRSDLAFSGAIDYALYNRINDNDFLGSLISILSNKMEDGDLDIYKGVTLCEEEFNLIKIKYAYDENKECIISSRSWYYRDVPFWIYPSHESNWVDIMYFAQAYAHCVRKDNKVLYINQLLKRHSPLEMNRMGYQRIPSYFFAKGMFSEYLKLLDMFLYINDFIRVLSDEESSKFKVQREKISTMLLKDPNGLPTEDNLKRFDDWKCKKKIESGEIAGMCHDSSWDTEMMRGRIFYYCNGMVCDSDKRVSDVLKSQKLSEIPTGMLEEIFHNLSLGTNDGSGILKILKIMILKTLGPVRTPDNDFYLKGSGLSKPELLSYRRSH